MQRLKKRNSLRRQQTKETNSTSNYPVRSISPSYSPISIDNFEIAESRREYLESEDSRDEPLNLSIHRPSEFDEPKFEPLNLCLRDLLKSTESMDIDYSRLEADFIKYSNLPNEELNSEISSLLKGSTPFNQ